MQPSLDEQKLEALWRDPAHWRLRWLYYAPADPRVFVPKRGGDWSGQTLNWGRPSSWGVATAMLLPVLLVAGFALWATR
jgi:uncharacterized membrane protein